MHRVNKARQAGFVPYGEDLTHHRTTSEYQPCFDHIPNTNIHGHRFTGERGFVEGSLPIDDASVSWNQFTAADFDFIARSNQVDGNHLRFRRCLGSHGQRWTSCHGEAKSGGCSRNGHFGCQTEGLVVVDFPGRAGQTVQSTLHGFPRFEQRVAFQMSGERHQNGDDERFFPHAENARSENGKTGQDLETHLQISKRGNGFLEHLQSPNQHTREGENWNQKAVITHQFSQHDDHEHRQGDASTDQPPLVGSESVGCRRGKLWFCTDHVLEGLLSRLDQILLCTGDQLNKDTVVIGDFGVKDPGLPPNHPFQLGDGDAVAMRNRFGPNANKFVVLDIGGVTQRTKHGRNFGHGALFKVNADLHLARGGRNVGVRDLFHVAKCTHGLGCTIRTIHAH